MYFMEIDVCVCVDLISDLLFSVEQSHISPYKSAFYYAIKYHPLSNCFRSIQAETVNTEYFSLPHREIRDKDSSFMALVPR